MSDILTPAESEAYGLLDRVVQLLLDQIVADGPSRAVDLAELLPHLNAVQRAILSNGAARCNPKKYRVLGGEIGWNPIPGPTTQKYYDHEGKIISYSAWSQMFAQEQPLCFNQLGPDLQVLTIWTGVNADPASRQPLIYHSEIYGGDKNGTEMNTATREEAKAAHAELVKDARSA